MKNSFTPHLFDYEWQIKNGYPAKGIENHKCKVFGTFICGGGSSMGYKLAGYEHLGGVELDQKVAEVYKKNHNPKYLFVEDIRDFNNRGDLPSDLFDLDLLDGAPPCSTFSTAGEREKAWGKHKKFAEGQKLQRLDDLVFVYCDTIKKLQPKVCILENVSGLLKGNAKVYAKEIMRKITEAGYRVQVFLLNASTMGVPQSRERTFFIGLRDDFRFSKLELKFNEEPILAKEIIDYDDTTCNISPFQKNLFYKRCNTDYSLADILIRTENRKSYFNFKLLHNNNLISTLTTNKSNFILYDIPRLLNEKEWKLASSFPLDYDSTGKDIHWLIGMSVPPVMTAQISYQIYKQWLCKIHGEESPFSQQ